MQFIFGHHHCQMNPMELATERSRPPSLISALNLEGNGMEPSKNYRLLANLGPHHDVRRKYRVWAKTRAIEEAESQSPPQSPRFRAIEEAESQSPPQSPPQFPEAQSHSETDGLCPDGALTLPKAQSQRSGASQWLNAPSKAHPDSCRPCWFTAKNKGCHRNGCLYCHQPHDTADVRLSHGGGRSRQRQAQRDFLNAHIRVKGTSQSPAAPEEQHCNLPRWPLSDFQAVRMGLVLPKSDTKNDRR
jgi:hypothetical protein